MLFILCVLLLYWDNVVECNRPAPLRVSVELWELANPANVTLSVEDGWLIVPDDDADDDIFSEHVQDAIHMNCDALECEPKTDWSSVQSWVAVLHYPNVYAFTQTNILEQVQQTVIWGASAVLLLAINADYIRFMETDSSLPIPLVLISTNVTNILKALANSTRVLVSIIAKDRTSESEVSNNFCRLTFWATCGRIFSGDDSPWEGTVCMDAPKNDMNNADEIWTGFCIALLFIGLFVLLRSNNNNNTDSDRGWQLQLIMNRARQNSMAEVLLQLGCIRFDDAYGGKSKIWGHVGVEGAGDTCSICLEMYSAGQVLRCLPCEHYFHRQCVDVWLVEQCTCPLCKRNILSQAT